MQLHKAIYRILNVIVYILFSTTTEDRGSLTVEEGLDMEDHFTRGGSIKERERSNLLGNINQKVCIAKRLYQICNKSEKNTSCYTHDYSFLNFNQTRGNRKFGDIRRKNRKEDEDSWLMDPNNYHISNAMKINPDSFVFLSLHCLMSITTLVQNPFFLFLS